MHFETDGGDADIINELFHQYDDDLESWDKLGKFIQRLGKLEVRKNVLSFLVGK